MEKTMKRLLSLAVALVLVLGLIPVSQLQVKADHVVDLETVNAELDTASTTCAACGATGITWTALTTDGVTQESGSGHYYVPAGTTVGAAASLVALTINGGTFCLHLGTTDSTLYTNMQITGGTINLMGLGKLRRLTSARPITLKGAATLNIYGGDIIGAQGSSGTASLSADGGTIYIKGTSDTERANILITGTAKVRLGNIKGTNSDGGNIWAQYADVTVAGDAHIYSGTSTQGYGGNFYLENASLTVDGGQINSGDSTATGKGGGNIYIKSGELNINGGQIFLGTTGNAGGNVMVHTGSTVKMTGGEVYSGTAKNGGSFWVVAGSTLEITGGYVAGNGQTDEEANNSSIIYSRNDVTITGGTIGVLEAGTEKPGSILMADGTLTLGATTVAASTIYAGADGYEGAVVKLDGATSFDKDSKVVLTAETDATLQVTSNFTGTAYIDGAYGTVFENVTVDSAATGTLASTASGNPTVFSYNNGAKVADYQIRNADGFVKWTIDPIADCGDNQFIRASKANTLDIGDNDVCLDLHGKDMTITGTGTLSLIDNKNDSYDASACGTVTFGEGATIELIRDVTALNGNRYVTIDNEDGTVSAHRIAMDLVSVALSTANAGYYYQAQYQFDDIVKANIDSYGIAASKIDMPGADFSTEKSGSEFVNAWTTETEALTSGDTVNGHGIINVLKAGEDNAARGKTKMYANPYIVINANAETAVPMVADTENAGSEAGVALSLYDILAAIDSNWTDFAAAQEQVDAFVANEAWAEDIAGWTFQNIGK